VEGLWYMAFGFRCSAHVAWSIRNNSAFRNLQSKISHIRFPTSSQRPAVQLNIKQPSKAIQQIRNPHSAIRNRIFPPSASLPRHSPAHQGRSRVPLPTSRICLLTSVLCLLSSVLSDGDLEKVLSGGDILNRYLDKIFGFQLQTAGQG